MIYREKWGLKAMSEYPFSERRGFESVFVVWKVRQFINSDMCVIHNAKAE
jgi:hypothetical protein